MANIVIINRHNSSVTLTTPEKKQLLPGNNNLSEEFWELAIQNPGTKLYVEGGILIERRDIPAAPPMTEDTNAVDMDTMLRNIAKCTRMDFLERWGKDNRPVVQKAVERRIALLKRQAKDEADDIRDIEPVTQVTEDLKETPKKRGPKSNK